jgi:threonine synthase
MRSTFICAGCGYEVSRNEPLPFRCPRIREGDDIDHILTRSGGVSGADVGTHDEDNPFVAYRQFFHSYHVGRARGLTDDDYVDIVRELDAKVAGVDGHGFSITPFVESVDLGHSLGLSGPVWVKDETGNVSGTHKGRHLIGILIWLEMVERTGLLNPEIKPRLAIASCGNAALAAAVLARAGNRPLEVFVPPDADRVIVDRLQQLGALLTACPRSTSGTGDPCVTRFREAVAGGALPFACQGNENGLTIEGGKTLGYEMVSSLRAKGQTLDRVFIQVGGGALASACIQALYDARDLGLIDRLPRIHAVQTEGAYPLRVAYDAVVDRIFDEIEDSMPQNDAERASFIVEGVSPYLVEDTLRYSAAHRSEFMRPWPTSPRSVAGGILDDETYDWLMIVRGMLATGGFPIVVSEDRLREAHAAARRHTDILVDPTGSAGLAGALELAEKNLLRSDETLALLFTGVERNSNPL